MFNDSIKRSFTLSFDSLSTEEKVINTQMEYQVDQNINSPKCLIIAHQTEYGIGGPSKAINIAIFDSLNGRKYHVDINGI